MRLHSATWAAERDAERLGRSEGSRSVFAGIRPESFEDATLVGDARDRGSDVPREARPGSSRWAPSCTRISASRATGFELQELQELAQDSGAGEVPGGGGDRRRRGAPRCGQQGARRLGRRWSYGSTPTKLHFFDPGKR